MDDLINIIRREAFNAISHFARPTILSVTAYNSATHSVKGILQPYGVESNWIAISYPHATKNGGVAVGPKVGSAEGFDGDQMVVLFIGGDPDSPVAIGRLYSDQDPPPVVQSGEVVMQHESGTHVFLDQDGQLIASRTDGSMVKLTKDGDVVSQPAPGRMAYHGGDPSTGGTFDFVMTASGPSTNVKAKIG